MSNSMTSISTFLFESHNVRTISDGDGEPWFFLTDVCKAIGLNNPSMVKGQLDGEDTQVIDSSTLSSMEGSKINQLVNIVNESGLYQTVFMSRKPEAKKFKRWVTSEVLPSIRKTGSYTGEPAQPQAPVEILSNKEKQETIDWLLGLADRYGDDALRMIALDKAKNSVAPGVDGNSAKLLEGPQPFQTSDLLDGMGLTDKWIRQNAQAVGKRLAMSYRTEHQGEEPMTTPRFIDGKQRNVKLYPPEWRERAERLVLRMIG